MADIIWFMKSINVLNMEKTLEETIDLGVEKGVAMNKLLNIYDKLRFWYRENNCFGDYCELKYVNNELSKYIAHQ